MSVVAAAVTAVVALRLNDGAVPRWRERRVCRWLAEQRGGVLKLRFERGGLRRGCGAAHHLVELLAQTREAVLGGLQHQDYPFGTLVQRLRPQRDPSRSPVFQAMFVLQKGLFGGGDDLTGFAMNVEGAKVDFAGLQMEAVALEQRIAQFDLTLTAGEVNGQLHASLLELLSDSCSAAMDEALGLDQ